MSLAPSSISNQSLLHQVTPLPATQLRKASTVTIKCWQLRNLSSKGTVVTRCVALRVAGAVWGKNQLLTQASKSVVFPVIVWRINRTISMRRVGIRLLIRMLSSRIAMRLSASSLMKCQSECNSKRILTASRQIRARPSRQILSTSSEGRPVVGKRPIKFFIQTRMLTVHLLKVCITTKTMLRRVASSLPPLLKLQRHQIANERTAVTSPAVVSEKECSGME